MYRIPNWKRIFLFIITATLFTFSCQDRESSFSKTSYAKDREELALKEQKNPLAFLNITAEGHKGFLTFGKTQIKGIIRNTASLCTYSKIRIRVLSFDKSGKILEEHEESIDQKISPGAVTGFKTAYRLPRLADSLTVAVLSADAEIVPKGEP